MKYLVNLSILMLYNCFFIQAQDFKCIPKTYNRLIQRAVELVENGKYDEAIAKYTSAKMYCPKKTIEVDKRIAKIFELVNNQRIRALNAEKGMRVANTGMADLLLKNADQFIMNLNYEAALKNIITVIELKTLPGSDVGKHLMEIVFWYNEVGDIAQAVTLIKTLVQLYPKKKRIVENYKFFNKERVRFLLKKLDISAYQKYEERYYPKMITVNKGYHKRYLPEEHNCNYEEELENGYESSNNILVSSFQIADSETTIWQFNLYKTAIDKQLNDNMKVNKGNSPCSNITFEEAIKYCNWLSQQKNKPLAYDISNNTWIDTSNCYRLPTVDEWEFAALNGKSQENYNYSYINNMNLNQVGWYSVNSDGLIHEGKAFTPNTLDLYDMNGNLREWCWDAPSPESSMDINDRICKGGSFRDTEDQCCIFKYITKSSTVQYDDTGLRIVLSF